VGDFPDVEIGLSFIRYVKGMGQYLPFKNGGKGVFDPINFYNRYFSGPGRV